MKHWRDDYEGGRSSWEDQDWNRGRIDWRARAIQMGCILMGMILTALLVVGMGMLWEGGAR